MDVTEANEDWQNGEAEERANLSDILSEEEMKVY